MKKRTLVLLVIAALCGVCGAETMNFTDVEPRILHDIRARLPRGWNCSAYQGDAVKEVPHGLDKPVFQVVASNTNLAFLLSTNAPHPKMQNPIVPLYFYRHSEKAGIMKVIEKERIYSWNIPIYFGETDEFVVVTSPAYVNGGWFTLEARRGLRPMWKVLRDLIPNKEKTGVDELAADN
jgi:hypothetical protein